MKWLGNGWRYPLSFPLALVWLPTVFSRIVSVDDSDSGIIYSTTWMVGNTCSTCTARPDPARINGGTWHDSTRYPGDMDNLYFEYTFTGTGIAIYAIIINVPDNQGVFITRNDLMLTVDDVQVSTFVHEPSGDNSYEYNRQVFNIQNLDNRVHTLHVRLRQNSMMLFDYLDYTVPDAATHTSYFNPSNPGSGSGGSTSEPPSSSSDASSGPTTAPTPSNMANRQGSSGASTVTVNGTVIVVNSTGAAVSSGTPTGSIPSSMTNDRSPLATTVSENQTNNNTSLPKAARIGIAFSIITLSFILGLLCFFFWRKRRRRQPQFRMIEDPEAPPTSAASPSALPATVTPAPNRKMLMNSNSTFPLNDALSIVFSSRASIGTNPGAETQMRTGTTPRDTGNRINSENQDLGDNQKRRRHPGPLTTSETQTAPPPYEP